MRIKSILTTTHVDKHGDRMSRRALEHAASEFKNSDRIYWVYWNHQTTLPPIGYIIDQYVEERDDGEAQLIGEIDLISNYEVVPKLSSPASGLDFTDADIQDSMMDTEPSPGFLQISYDPQNIDPTDAEATIKAIDEVVDTKHQQYIRKAEIPQPVIWILVAFAGGFIARFGELAADKSISLFKDLNARFAQLLLKVKNSATSDVIFSIPIDGSNTIVEGVVEDATSKMLSSVWERLPKLYGAAKHIISSNRPDFFSEIKFLYNPGTSKWEINYLTIWKTRRVILGPRYYQVGHPLHKRYSEQLDDQQSSKAREENESESNDSADK